MMQCTKCGSKEVRKDGTHYGLQRYYCRGHKGTFGETQYPKIDHSLKCDRCGEENRAVREYENGNLTGKYLCRKCYQKDWFQAARRTGNLDPNSSQAKGDRFEELSCTLFRLTNLNIENDNYKSPIDHQRHHILGITDSQGRLYDKINGRWSFTRINRYHYKDIDNIISYCASHDGKIIERIYIFPWEEILRRTGITIVKYDSIGRLYKNGWYKNYRIYDEDLIRMANDIWRVIIKE